MCSWATSRFSKQVLVLEISNSEVINTQKSLQKYVDENNYLEMNRRNLVYVLKLGII